MIHSSPAIPAKRAPAPAGCVPRGSALAAGDAIPGATPEEWAQFADDLCGYGLFVDLLPVVSDTSLAISERSKLAAAGKTPSIVNRAGKIAGIPRWTEKRATQVEVERWSRDPRLGACLQTRYARAVDIDDEAIGDAVEQFTAEFFGFALPCRYRANSGKRLLLLLVQGEIAKSVVRTANGAIELLGNGQQCVVAGTHPSGERYRWRGLGPSLPEVGADCYAEFVRALGERFGAGEIERGSLRKRDADIDLPDAVADFIRDQGLSLGEGRGMVYVDCPKKELHSCDNGESQTAWLVAGSNGHTSGRFHCFHASCGVTQDEFLDHIGWDGRADFEALVEPEGESGSREITTPGFARDKHGAIEAVLDNVMRAVEAPEWTGTDFAYDTFFGSIVISPHGRGEWRPLEDADYVALRRWLEKRDFKPIGRELIRDAVLGVAWSRRFDSAVDWLSALEWDGVARIETMLPDLFGTEDTPYTRAVGRYWMTAHAGRVLDPGCQADMVPVLYGPQNSGKSSACMALAPSPDAYAKFDLGHKDADLSRKMRGKLVGELDELRGFQGRTAEANKAWLSQRFEEWTPKYQEFGTKLMRRMVFVGTTNRDDFLDDPTGERRWLPFEIKSTIDLGALAAVRDQLWAEGAALWRSNGVEWEAAYELAKDEHARFKRVDVWAEAIERWWTMRDWSADWSDPENGLVGFSAEKIAIEALGLSAARMSNADCARMSNSLRFCGFSHDRVRFEGRRPRFWTKWTALDQSRVVQGDI